MNGNETWNNVYVLPSKTTVVSGGGDLCRGQGGGGPVPLGCLAPPLPLPPSPPAVLSNTTPSIPPGTSRAAPPGGLPAAPLIIIYFSSASVGSRCVSLQNKCLPRCTALTGTLLYREKIQRKKRHAVLQMLSTKFHFVMIKISSKNRMIN